MLRLVWFDWIYGNRIAFQTLVRQFGLKYALVLAATVQWKLLFSNPFRQLPAKSLTTAERCSRRQLAPALILYELLLEQHNPNEARIHVGTLVSAVAIEFLRFNVPIINTSDRLLSQERQLTSFRALCQRFFNAHGKAGLNEDGLWFHVNHCWFSHYCRELGYRDLAEIFCQADATYFRNNQPSLIFYRSRTIAAGDDLCNFSFEFRDN